jgi:peptidoglycan/xylan/chitin deacetylase (PgdA/CDA1 family)
MGRWFRKCCFLCHFGAQRLTSRPKVITTSWDDGHPRDWEVADLLAKYGLKGTFYVPRMNSEREVMPIQDVKELAQDFEIGGHTLNHISLHPIDEGKAVAEIRGSQEWLSGLLGVAPKAFCYPRGRFGSAIQRLVRDAGFHYARTVQLMRTDLPDAFAAPTTLQLFEHSRSGYLRNFLRRCDIRTVFRYGVSLRARTDLGFLTDHFLDGVESEGGIFHLWGHSWEIEQHGLWATLEAVLAKLAARKNFRFVFNSELADLSF